jgi:hypothetical protein
MYEVNFLGCIAYRRSDNNTVTIKQTERLPFFELLVDKDVHNFSI